MRIMKSILVCCLLVPATPALSANVERRCAEASGKRADEDLAKGYITQDQWIDRQAELFEHCIETSPKPPEKNPDQCILLDQIVWVC